VACQVDHEGVQKRPRESFIGKKLRNVEQIARMLAVERSHHLAAKAVLEGKHRCLDIAEDVFDRRPRACVQRRTHAAAQDGVRLDRDPCCPFPHHEFFAIGASLLHAGSRDAFPHLLRDPGERLANGAQRFVSPGDLQIREVEIDRQPRQVAEKEIDRRAALQRKIALPGDATQHAHCEPRLRHERIVSFEHSIRRAA